MESDQRFYWRRAAEEYYAAERAVTPAARSRRRELAEHYVSRLRESGISFHFANGGTPPSAITAEKPRLSDKLLEWPLPQRSA